LRVIEYDRLYTGSFRRKCQYFGSRQYQSLWEKLHLNTCLILNGYRDTDVWNYRCNSVRYLWVGWRTKYGQEKMDTQRRIARSHLGCCCPQKHVRRSTQTINDLRTRITKCIEVENCALLSHYAASSGNFLPKFPDNFSVPSSWVLKIGPKGCPETSVRNYHYSLHNNPEGRSSHLVRGGSPKYTIRLTVRFSNICEL